MSKSRSRKKGGLFANVFWAFVILSLVFAWFKTPVPADTSVMEFAEAKSKSVEAWVQNFTAGGFDLPDLLRGSSGLSIDLDGEKQVLGDGTKAGDGDTNSAEVSKSELGNELNALTVAEPKSVNYDRDEWDHWSSQGSSCWTTRDAVLLEEAKEGSVQLLDADKNPVSEVSNACYVASGTWNDPFSGQTFTDPSELDIDHMIPLSYAAQHGGQAWSADKKEQYANSQDYANHLMAVDLSENRSKGDQGPSEWKPSNKDYYCEYATNWITISKTWGLSISPADKNALASMIGTC